MGRRWEKDHDLGTFEGLPRVRETGSGAGCAVTGALGILSGTRTRTEAASGLGLGGGHTQRGTVPEARGAGMQDSEHDSAHGLDVTPRKVAPRVGQAVGGQVGKGTGPVTGPAGPTRDGTRGTEALSPRRPRRPAVDGTKDPGRSSASPGKAEAPRLCDSVTPGPAHLLGCELPAGLVHVLDLHVGLVAVLLLEVLREAAVLLPPAVLVVDGPGPRDGALRARSCLRCPRGLPRWPLPPPAAPPPPARPATLTSCPRCSTRPTAGTCWGP